ncbi:MAG: hypothetical protein KF760_19085 [Candidatus Eremiobacteraeota bacterium]|nr:hypothetical protein [Candidatus Eremiobacteraeota bacterium]MCW5870276.1 hypothetical protein [Candidatus Eremiobacteraeota bacterium]
MKKSLAPALLLLLWGCAPPEGTPNTTSTVAISHATSTVTPSATPTAVAASGATAKLPEPDLPEKLLKNYQPAPLEPKLKESETWWADSGIQDNRLGYYTSNDSVAQIEAQLVPVFTAGGNKPYLEGIGPVFDYDGNRVCIMKRSAGGEQLFVIAPLGTARQVPKSLRALKLPPIPAEELANKTTLVVLATGEGLGEHIDHMLGQAGLVITPTPAPAETPDG